jgi:hypothetical protein
MIAAQDLIRDLRADLSPDDKNHKNKKKAKALPN